MGNWGGEPAHRSKLFAFTQGGFEPDARRYICLDSYKMGDLALAVRMEAKDSSFQKDVPSLRVVPQDGNGFAPVPERFPNKGECQLIGVRALEKAAVPALRIFQAIAGHHLESGLAQTLATVRVLIE